MNVVYVTVSGSPKENVTVKGIYWIVMKFAVEMLLKITAEPVIMI